MRYLFFLSVLFISTFSVFAQILSDEELNKMDSLLIFENDSLKIKHFLELKDDQIKVLNLDLDGYNHEKQRYFQLINYIKEIQIFSEERIELMIKQYLTFENTFIPKIAGRKASQIFQKFKESVGKRDNITALKYYIYAYNIKNRFINNIEEQIEQKLEEANSKYLNHEYDDALIMVDNCEMLSKTGYIAQPILNKIDVLKKSIKQSMRELEVSQKLYSQKEQITPRFHIVAGMNFMLKNTDLEDDRTWYFNAVVFGETYKYLIEKSETDLDYNFEINAAYYLYERFQLAAGMEYGRMKILTTNKLNGFKTNFDADYFSGQFCINYLFKTKAGLRPYIGPGLRIGWITRKQKVEEGSFWLISYYDVIKEKKYIIPQCIFNLGTEYISSLNNPLLLKTYFILYYNLKYNEMVGRYGWFFGCQFGFWF